MHRFKISVLLRSQTKWISNRIVFSNRLSNKLKYIKLNEFLLLSHPDLFALASDILTRSQKYFHQKAWLICI